MKVSNAQTVQSIVITLAEGMAHTSRAASARATVTSVLTDLRDHVQAAQLVKDCMLQAILQGKAETVRNADGTRNDKASNWKRDLSRAFNDAYPSTTSRLTLKTAGKGADRTVTLAFAEVTEKSAREKFLARVAAICEDVNATQAESASIRAKLEKLYDFEQARTEQGKEEAKQAAILAQTLAADAVTSRVEDMLTEKGIAITPENMEIARQFATM